jgi:hypothetical protein
MTINELMLEIIDLKGREAWGTDSFLASFGERGGPLS